ncbi:MAG: tetratricopeptide repeat protein [Parachlamydiaceae bacterium]
MNLNKKLLIASFVGGLIAISLVGTYVYQLNEKTRITLANEASNQEDLALAKRKLQEWQPLCAMELVKKHLNEIYQNTSFASEWLSISLQAGVKLQDARFLTELYSWEQKPFLENEEAALAVAENLIDQDRDQEFTHLKNWWQKECKYSEKWTLLEADHCARNGNSSKALNLLTAKKFKHPYEVDRLLRLAFLNLNENPRISWVHLSQACKIDPHNPDLRIYRAHFLNALGKDTLALQELNEAAVSHQKDSLLKEERIEQHIKNKDYFPAIALLEQELSREASPHLWKQALFLNKVVAPVNHDTKQLSNQHINAEIAFFLNLREGYYQPDIEVNEELAGSEELFWLKMIHLLKMGHEEQAYRLALKDRNSDYYHPELRQALVRTLSFRNPFIASEEFLPSGTKHFLFQQLENQVYSNELRSLLSSNEAFSVLFLAAGWNEAALQFVDHKEQLEGDLPVWYLLGITKALAHNRSINHAIGFAKIQKPHPHLALLLGKLYSTNNASDLAIIIFKKITDSNLPNREQASFFLAKEYLKQGEFSLAKKAITVHSAWQTVEGRLLLANLALSLGDQVGAEALFASIAHQSPEATSYFASKAFYEKNYDIAYQLTKKLFKENPMNEAFQKNLEKIKLARKGLL